MSTKRFKTANEIINQVGVEAGLTKQVDVFASQDKAFVQLITLANACGTELFQHNAWERIQRTHTIITKAGDDGVYDLPDDFAYMIDQTNWDRTRDNPMTPISPQEWTWLKGRDLVSDTIYLSFRQKEGKILIFPYADGGHEPPPDLELTFEYVSRGWILAGGVPNSYTDTLKAAADVILYEAYLFERLLKVRFLEARGFDATAAKAQLKEAAIAWVGKDVSAPILNPAHGGITDPYISACNLPDTGYGH